MINSKVSFNTLKKELTDEEGLKYRPYKCTAGHWTIGIGHNIDAMPIDDIIGRKYSLSITLTKKEVDDIFLHDLNNVLNDLADHIPWFDELPGYQQYVMISLVFNLGIGGLLKFKNTLKSWSKGNIDGVIYGLRNSKWYRQVGRRSPKLIGILANQEI